MAGRGHNATLPAWMTAVASQKSVGKDHDGEATKKTRTVDDIKVDLPTWGNFSVPGEGRKARELRIKADLMLREEELSTAVPVKKLRFANERNLFSISSVIVGSRVTIHLKNENQLLGLVESSSPDNSGVELSDVEETCGRTGNKTTHDYLVVRGSTIRFISFPYEINVVGRLDALEAIRSKRKWKLDVLSGHIDDKTTEVWMNDQEERMDFDDNLFG